MTYNVPFSDLGRYKTPWLVTPPAADILAAIRRGRKYADLAADYGVSESTLRRRVHDSGLVGRHQRHAVIAPLVDDDEPAWMAEALCTQVDPESFFPEQGCSPADAKRICGDCPVRVACLAYALEHDERHGVWGSTTPAERRAMKKAGLS